MSDLSADRKRCKRWDIPGHAHYQTFSCFRSQPFLSRDRTCRWLVDAINQARERQPFDLWAWVFMPEHVHLIVWPHEGVEISAILSAIKQPVAKRAVNWVAKNEPAFLSRMEDRQPNGKVCRRFWQRGGGYDRNLWTAEELAEKVRYIHLNPVRRGLVEHPRDWPWSSWRASHEGVDEPLRIDRQSFPGLRV